MSINKDQEKEGTLFRILLSDCLICGSTKLKESKSTVSIQPKQDETILFFNIDDKANPRCGLRKLLYGNAEGKKICDLLILYAKGSDRIICFTELKDNISDLGKAIEQIIETHESLKLYLVGSKFICKAFVSAPTGSVPRQHEAFEQKLKKAFQTNNFAFNNNNSLDNFLRGVIPKIDKGKPKKGIKR